jgi:hypothetical protein
MSRFSSPKYQRPSPANFPRQIPLHVNLTPILHFVTYSILNTPINCVWQDWLESAFPSTVPAAVEVPNTKEKATSEEKKQVLSVKNTLIKFVMDQTIGAAFNIPLFIGIIGMVKGQSVDKINHSIKTVRSRLNTKHGFSLQWLTIFLGLCRHVSLRYETLACRLFNKFCCCPRTTSCYLWQSGRCGLEYLLESQGEIGRVELTGISTFISLLEHMSRVFKWAEKAYKKSR